LENFGPTVYYLCKSTRQAGYQPHPKNDKSPKRAIQQVLSFLNNGETVQTAMKKSALIENHVSHSSRLRLEQWQNLSPAEKHQVELKLAAEARAAQPVHADESLHIL